MKNRWGVALGVVCGLLGAGAIWLASSPPRGNPIQLLPPPTPAPIQVYVTGEVIKPGVYSLPVGSRVQDAVQAAGGFAADAKTELNLAAALQDGDRVQVASTIQVQEAAETGSTLGAPENATGQQPTSGFVGVVNINTASQDELETLSGIGPVTAQKIIDYRETNGLFIGIEDIQKISGIGSVNFEKFKDQITVGD